MPHMHYVAFSRVKKLDDLYILNMNEDTMAIDNDVNIEMDRLRTEAVLELCYVNQMCWQQMSLDLLKQGYVEWMKMYILL